MCTCASCDSLVDECSKITKKKKEKKSLRDNKRASVKYLAFG